MVTLEIRLIASPMEVNLFCVRNQFNIKTGELIIGATPFVITIVLFLITVLFVRQ